MCIDAAVSRDMAALALQSREDREFIERPDMARTEPKEVPYHTVPYYDIPNHTIPDIGRTEGGVGFTEQLSEASVQSGLAQSAACSLSIAQLNHQIPDNFKCWSDPSRYRCMHIL